MLFDDRAFYRLPPKNFDQDELIRGVSEILGQFPSVLCVSVRTHNAFQLFVDEDGVVWADADAVFELDSYDCWCEDCFEFVVPPAFVRVVTRPRLLELGWAMRSQLRCADVYERSWRPPVNVDLVALSIGCALINAYGVSETDEVELEVIHVTPSFDPRWDGVSLSKWEAFRLACDCT